MDYKFFPISDNIEVPGPKGLNPEQEREWIARYKREHDVEAMEAEYQQLLKDIADGNLIPAEQVLKELEEDDVPV